MFATGGLDKAIILYDKPLNNKGKNIFEVCKVIH